MNQPGYGALFIGKGKDMFVALGTINADTNITNIANIAEILLQGTCELSAGEGIVLPSSNWAFFPLDENFRPYAVNATIFFDGGSLPAKYMGIAKEKKHGYGVVIEERCYDNMFIQYVVAFSPQHVAPYYDSELTRL